MFGPKCWNVTTAPGKRFGAAVIAAIPTREACLHSYVLDNFDHWGGGGGLHLGRSSFFRGLIRCASSRVRFGSDFAKVYETIEAEKSDDSFPHDIA
jgi:hypothetical protein